MGWIGSLLALAVILGGSSWAGEASAHGTFADRLVAATAQVDQRPTDPKGWLHRADLYRTHRDWEQALSDLDVAEALAPERSEVAYLRGRTLLEALRPGEAVDVLERYTELRPEDPDGHAAHARALAAIDRSVEAAEAWTRAIRTQPVAVPDYYVERARALARSGPNYLDGALRGLDDAIERHGPLTALQLEAIDIEVESGDIDGALGRLSLLASRSPRSERWHIRRGELLERAGRHEDAAQAYRDALDAIANLPPARRHIAATAGLENQARDAVVRLGTWVR